MVLAVCRRALGDLHAAEDAFQATFLVLVKKAASVHPPEAVGGWLYGVARKAALEALAGGRRKCEKLVPEIPDRPAPDSAARTEPDTRAILDEEVAALPGILRASVVLCELGGVCRKEA